MGAVTKCPPVLARVFRGPHVESVHRGNLAVCDDAGRLRERCGDADAPVYVRSAAKPFQAMPLLLAGGEKRFRLGDAELALLCASHGGEPAHVAKARDLLARGGFRAADLECGAHAPMHEPSARALLRKGEAPTALHNNCSGKHAGMLLACRLLDLPMAGYTDPSHPLQRRIRTLLAYYACVPESRITVGVDGCHLPVFRLPLSGLAAAYARLVAPRLSGEDAPAAAMRSRLVRAMTRRPDMVAGTGRFTTDFMARGKGRWVGKEGAEGVYAAAVLPRRKGEKAVGIAFKIEDGSARPRDAVTLSVLERLGLLPLEDRRALAAYAEPVVVNARGAEVGRIEADVPMTAPRRGRR
jgi:L-asparaginase II